MDELDEGKIADVALAIDSLDVRYSCSTQTLYTAIAMWIAGQAVKEGLTPQDFMEEINLVQVADHYAGEFRKLDQTRMTVN